MSKMMNRYLVVLLLGHLSTRCIGAEDGSVCKICDCSNRKVIDCDGRSLTSCFEPSEWRVATAPNNTYAEVNLSNNHFGRVTQFPNMTVTKLNLRNNRIVKIEDRAFRNLSQLLELDLSDNELTAATLQPQIFQGPFSIEYYEPLPMRHLDLSGNEIHSLNALLFEHLPHLRRLSLKRNPFKMLDKSTVVAISSLRSIEVLDLSYMQLKELPIGFLHSIRYLKELILKGNYLKQVPSDVLCESHNLAFLNLDNNPINVISANRPFPEMPSLRRLHLSYMTELKRIEEGSMQGLTGLEYLDCKQNEKLEYVSPLAFAKNESDEFRPNVTWLELNDNGLRYLNRSFLHFDRMNYINVQGNLWSCDCENQWMVNELVPILLKIRMTANGLVCSSPTALEGQHFLALHKIKYEMRCLDYYDNHPENDSIILISVFSIIIAVMAVGLIAVWKIKMGTCRRGGRVEYSRAFYRPAHTDDRY